VVTFAVYLFASALRVKLPPVTTSQLFR